MPLDNTAKIADIINSLQNNMVGLETKQILIDIINNDDTLTSLYTDIRRQEIITSLNAWGAGLILTDTWSQIKDRVSQIATWDTDLIANNIPLGKNIFGVDGQLSSLLMAGDGVTLYDSGVISNSSGMTGSGTGTFICARWSNPTSGNYVYFVMGFSGKVRISRIVAPSEANGTPVYSRIYKNGQPVGTEKTETTRIDFPGQILFTEDIDVSKGDKLALFAKSSQQWGVKQFIMKVNDIPISEQKLSATNPF